MNPRKEGQGNDAMGQCVMGGGQGDIIGVDVRDEYEISGEVMDLNTMRILGVWDANRG